MSNLTAYTPVPENSRATPGLFDSRFNVVHTNLNQVNNDLSTVSLIASSVSGSGLTGYRDVTVTRYGGAVGDGTTNDAAAFTTGATSTATQAVLYVPSAASVYKIGTASTITGTLSPIRGAILRPSSGVTVTVLGAVNAQSYPIFDTSAGGGFDFSHSREIHLFDARWFGVVGDNATNDQPALTRMMAQIPDYSTVVFAPGMVMSLGTTWTIQSRRGITLRPSAVPLPDGSHSVKFTWNGGTTGGAMLQLFSCDNCRIGGPEVGGFYWDMGSRGTANYADVGIDIDKNGLLDANGASCNGTSCEVIGNVFNITSASAKTFWGVRISNTANTNQEKVHVDGNHFFGWSDRAANLQVLTLSLTGGTGDFVITSGNVTMDSTYKDRRFVVAGLATTIATVIDGTHGTINSPPAAWASGTNYNRGDLVTYSGTVYQQIAFGSQNNNQPDISPTVWSPMTNTYALIGQTYGIGIDVGPSANAIGESFYKNSFSAMGICINARGGNIISRENNFSNVGDCIRSATNHASSDKDSDMEYCERYINFLGGGAWTVSTPRMGASEHQYPGSGWFNPAGAPFTFHGATFDAVPHTAVLDMSQAAAPILLYGNQYQTGTTPQLLGLIDVNGYPAAPAFGEGRAQVICLDSVPGLPFPYFGGALGQFSYADPSNGGAALTGQAMSHAFGGDHYHVGILGRAISTLFGRDSSDINVGVRGTFSVGTSGRFDSKWRAVEAFFPVLANVGTATEMHGFHVTAPVITGSGSNVPVGLYIEDLQSGATSSLAATRAITQVGPGDANVFAGPTYFGSGSLATLAFGFSSESSLGFYRSGTSTIAPSYGTLNLATNSVRLSMRTAGSIDSTNLAVNEVAFSILGASGATLAIRSGGTIWYFNSSASTKG